MAAVLRQLRHRGAGGLELYKDSCLVRRIEMRMRVRGVGSLAGYADLLARDAAETDRLIGSLSVRVTGFFRDPESWKRLAEVLAGRPEETGSPFFAWSMGCSTGEEAWSLALLLHRAGTGFQVIGSDVNARAVLVAEAGVYDRAAGRAIREFLGGCLDPGADSQVRLPDELRQRVRFRREDLTRGQVSPEVYDLITCRNLLIYLSRAGQQRILDRAVASLRIGGVLMLGRTESPVALSSSALQPIDSTHRLYRKTG
jgi:chemotaxis methyl-accepting protein methylase